MRQQTTDGRQPTKNQQSAVCGPWSAVYRAAYDFCFTLFALFYLPLFILKGKHKDGFLSRFGKVPSEVKARLAGRKALWIHSVSVGESVQAVRLAAALRKRLPDATFVFTATTQTGRQVLEGSKKPEDAALYFPADFRASVRSFIKSVSPQALILLETEIWPNLIFELSTRRIPVYIVNGRISDKAMPAYRRVRRFLGPVFARLDGVAAQDETMKERFLELGVDEKKVFVTGNMKFDWTPSNGHEEAVKKIESMLKEGGPFVCIAGSTHEGEEKLLFDVYKSIRRVHPGFRLLVAPRHLERLGSIRRQAAQAEVPVMTCSEMDAYSHKEAPEAVLLLDKMGVLGELYRAADAVFVGGSLVPRGGHNLVEPAFFGKPVLFGPYMQNFREMAAQFKEASAAIQVQDASQLESELLSLMEDVSKKEKLGSAARSLLMRHQGATERNVKIVEELFK